jgi:hypothetical protein
MRNDSASIALADVVVTLLRLIDACKPAATTD